MIDYIKTMIAELNERLDHPFSAEGSRSRFMALVEETDRLDPRDFHPANRFEFVNLRRRIRNYLGLSDEQWEFINSCKWSKLSEPSVDSMVKILNRTELGETHGNWAGHGSNGCRPMALGVIQDTKALLSKFSEALDSYLGPDVRTKPREFPYVQNPDLRRIIERDYRDLTLRLFPVDAWKSVVIIAGSILEALLYDLLTRDASRVTAAMAASRAPKKRGRSVRDIQRDAHDDEWTLNDYIEVAEELGLLPAGWKTSVQAVLRDFRNCVHPRRELKMTDQITQGEAFQSVGALMRICEHIERNHP